MLSLHQSRFSSLSGQADLSYLCRDKSFKAHICNLDGQSYRLKNFNEMIQATREEHILKNGAYLSTPKAPKTRRRFNG